MLRSLFSGITGLRAHQTMMDVVGNNISNVNTTGFKSSTTIFEDTLSQMVRSAGTVTATSPRPHPHPHWRYPPCSVPCSPASPACGRTRR